MTRGILATIQPNILHVPFAYPKIHKTYTTRYLLITNFCTLIIIYS